MSETAAAPPVEKKVASLGKPQILRNNFSQQQNNGEQSGEEKNNIDTGADETELTEEQKLELEANKKNDAAAAITPKLTPEEIKKLYLDTFPETIELTEEQKAEKDTALEKRMLDLYISGKGTAEMYVKLKEIASADLTELSKAQLTTELKTKGFNDAEITAIQVERYYQLNPDEIEQGEDETEEDFTKRKELIKKKVQYGTEKLNSRSAHIQNTAKSILDGLKKALSEQDLQKQDKVKYAAKVEDTFKSLPRKLSIELGKQDNNDLGLVEVDIPETDIEEIKASLKDQSKLDKLLYNEDGNINVEYVAKLLLNEKLIQKIARETLFEGQTRQVKIFEKTFGAANPHAIGVGGSSSPNRDGSGKVASAGKVQRVNNPRRK